MTPRKSTAPSRPAKKPRHAHSRKPARPKSTSSVRRTPGALFEKLVALQARLRGPKGCPWDREQTPQSLRTFLVEETYEALAALDSGDADEFADELGDLLLQVIFQSLLARESGQFDIRDVIERVHDKMVRRHPHVFGARRAKDAAEVLRNWEQMKAEERRTGKSVDAKSSAAKKSAVKSAGVEERPSLLDGIPRSLPALLEAAKLTRRAAHIGFDWNRANDILEKIREECAEIAAELPRSGAKLSGPAVARLENEVGDLLFTAVNVARFLGIDPEAALKRANSKFSRRFRWMEHEAASAASASSRASAPAPSSALAAVSRDEMERLWNRAKVAARARS